MKLAKKNHFGFTLIESLAVISIIGILATLAIYTYTNVLSRGRDSRRKSDLTAIALGFQARYDTQTCSNPADLAYYPGRGIGDQGKWELITDLKDNDQDCETLTEYIITIPVNPNDPQNFFPYRFNLSTKDPGEFEIKGKHYRLAARLEKVSSLQEQADFAKMMELWVDSFGGAYLPPGGGGSGSDPYNYVIGK